MKTFAPENVRKALERLEMAGVVRLKPIGTALAVARPKGHDVTGQLVLRFPSLAWKDMTSDTNGNGYSQLCSRLGIDEGLATAALEVRE